MLDDTGSVTTEMSSKRLSMRLIVRHCLKATGHYWMKKYIRWCGVIQKILFGLYTPCYTSILFELGGGAVCSAPSSGPSACLPAELLTVASMSASISPPSITDVG